jgi:hypothetical protein
LPSKKIVSVWKAAADTNHPIVIVAASSFSLLPRSDIETVIIERENARGWISQRAPYIDSRHALEMINRRARRTVFTYLAITHLGGAGTWVSVLLLAQAGHFVQEHGGQIAQAAVPFFADLAGRG